MKRANETTKRVSYLVALLSLGILASGAISEASAQHSTLNNPSALGNQIGKLERSITRLENLLKDSTCVFVRDFNDDGKTDGDDFLIWQANYGLESATRVPISKGNADCDNDVDDEDFEILIEFLR